MILCCWSGDWWGGGKGRGLCHTEVKGQEEQTAALTFRDTETVQQTGVGVNVFLWRQKRKRRRSRREAAQKKQFVSWTQIFVVSYRRGKKLLNGSKTSSLCFDLKDLIINGDFKLTEHFQVETNPLWGLKVWVLRSKMKVTDPPELGQKQVDLQGAADLTWTRRIRQNLHAWDPRQLHLEVALAVQEQISGGQSSTQTGLTGEQTGFCQFSPLRPMVHQKSRQVSGVICNGSECPRRRGWTRPLPLAWPDKAEPQGPKTDLWLLDRRQVIVSDLSVVPKVTPKVPPVR